jgi:predicted transcriptional regulator
METILLNKLDQSVMRKLRKHPDRTSYTVEYHTHEAIAQFLAKAEAEEEMENKIISFPNG